MKQHSCLHYTTEEDYLNLVIPFFRQGFLGNNFCMWIVLLQWGVENARAALREKMPNADTYIEKGRLEIISCDEWYSGFGIFDTDEMLVKWSTKEKDVLERGFNGLWVCGDGSWVKAEDWEKLTAYEESINKTIHATTITAMCTYSSKAVDINHAFLLSFFHDSTIRSDNGQLSVLGKT
ncbi:MAG: MEDS domain-containing protein [Candidatus Omnitrophota bacterium]